MFVYSGLSGQGALTRRETRVLLDMEKSAAVVRICALSYSLSNMCAYTTQINTPPQYNYSSSVIYIFY